MKGDCKSRFACRFFSMCAKENYMDLAREMWEAPEMERTGFIGSLRSVRIKYLTLLYRNGHYQEVKYAFSELFPP